MLQLRQLRRLLLRRLKRLLHLHLHHLHLRLHLLQVRPRRRPRVLHEVRRRVAGGRVARVRHRHMHALLRHRLVLVEPELTLLHRLCQRHRRGGHKHLVLLHRTDDVVAWHGRVGRDHDARQQRRDDDAGVAVRRSVLGVQVRVHVAHVAAVRRHRRVGRPHQRVQRVVSPPRPLGRLLGRLRPRVGAARPAPPLRTGRARRRRCRRGLALGRERAVAGDGQVGELVARGVVGLLRHVAAVVARVDIHLAIPPVAHARRVVLGHDAPLLAPLALEPGADGLVAVLLRLLVLVVVLLEMRLGLALEPRQPRALHLQHQLDLALLRQPQLRAHGRPRLRPRGRGARLLVRLLSAAALIDALDP